MASGSEDRTIKLWNLHTGEFECSLEGHFWEITSVAISPNGRWLASASEDRTVKLWNLHRGELLHTVKWRKRDWRNWGYLYSVIFSPDGQTLACGGPASIMLWILHTGKLYTLTREKPTYRGEYDSLAISPDSQILASCEDYNTVQLWNLQTREHISTLPKGDSSFGLVAFSPDGKTLIGSLNNYSDQAIAFWNLRASRIMHTLKVRYASGVPSDMLRDLAFSPDGQTLVSCSLNGDIQVWGIP